MRYTTPRGGSWCVFGRPCPREMWRRCGLPRRAGFEDAARSMSGTYGDTAVAPDGKFCELESKTLAQAQERPISSAGRKITITSHTLLRTGAVTPLTARRERFVKNAAQQLHRPRTHSTLETAQHCSTQPQRNHKQKWSRSKGIAFLDDDTLAVSSTAGELFLVCAYKREVLKKIPLGDGVKAESLACVPETRKVLVVDVKGYLCEVDCVSEKVSASRPRPPSNAAASHERLRLGFENVLRGWCGTGPEDQVRVLARRS